MSPNGGYATPVVASTVEPLGRAAVPVYATTDGKVLAGPAVPVVFISSGDLIQNGGKYYLEGEVSALPIVVKSGTYPVQGGKALPVYLVNP